MSRLAKVRPPGVGSGRRARTSSDDLLADLSRVALQLGQQTLSGTEYGQLGQYPLLTMCRRFGGWKNALGCVGLRPAHQLNVSAEVLLADILRVARQLNTTRLRYQDYARDGRYSRKVIYRLFGRWQTAAEALGLQPVITRPLSEKELFDNLRSVQKKLGRWPRYEELKRPLSKFGVTAYTARYGTFKKALIACELGEGDPKAFAHRQGSRSVNLRLRFTVLRRDHFRCCACGRSPATDHDVQLQVDHIKPWRDGGETTLANLQTLCQQCNGGKSDLPFETIQ